MITIKGRKFIQSWEPCNLKANKDPAGVWQIGYSSTRIYNNIGPLGNKRNVIEGDEITQSQAEFLFQEELDGISSFLLKVVPVQILSQENDALVSFIYNVGQNAFKSSTLRKLVIAGIRNDRLLLEFEKWKYIHKDGKLCQLAGLLKRRRAEYAIYANGVYYNNV